MKKIKNSLLCILLFCLFCFTLTACVNNNESQNKNFHSIKIDTEELFNYYFTFSLTNTLNNHYTFGNNIGTKSTSTISIIPKLTGFVDYTGYVELKAETKNETKSERILKNRRINIEFWGATTDIYEVNSETKQNDDTISFNDITYEFYASDMVITYHHEGLSGNNNLTYETISLTKYNYKSYLSISIENQSYRTTSYNDNDYNHRYPIYTYHYYQTYTVTPSSQIKGYKEFNNIKLTFDNGTTIALDALGKSTYKSDEYSAEKAIPNLSKIVGCIDFYPPAIYEY